MKSFEDYAFTCLDNLPPILMRRYAELACAATIERIAIVLDVRTGGAFGDAIEEIDALVDSGVVPDILFLDASDDVLVRRYSETRRKHPFAERTGNISAAIALERAALGPLRERATLVWETTHLTHGTLKRRVAETFVDDRDARRMHVAIVAFGFKYGHPAEADLVFDVRFLPNPNYEPLLHELTGDDEPVAAYLAGFPETETFFQLVAALMDFVIPRYLLEGKSHLTVAIGCTGGRHRSVYLAARLAAHLANTPDVAVTRSRRELDR